MKMPFLSSILMLSFFFNLYAINLAKAEDVSSKNEVKASKTPTLETKSIEQYMDDKKKTVKSRPTLTPKTRTEKTKEVKKSASPLSSPGEKSGIGLLKKPLQAKTPPKIGVPKRLDDNENEDINR
ncbi:MAG: hypothetical protein P9M03_03985 [Candidatus Theseobacter exili]|nr:hypothetical protein [Candidatus Theseobacter exili]